MIRLFVAVPLPEDARARLAGLCAGVRGAKWVAPENLHLTLRFIGEVDEETAADIDAALSKVRAPAFEVTLEGVGHFGSRKRARALWAGVADNSRLGHLHDKVEAALVRARLEPEGRKFSPHVTLARFKNTSARRVTAFVAQHGLFRAGPFPVGAFTLYSSFLSKGGAIYAPEAAYPLEPADK